MVTIEKFMPWGELEQRIRETPLLWQGEGDPVYPYENAVIRLESLAYADVRPTSLYVLRGNLAVQAAIASDLAIQDCHPLELEGGLLLKNEAGEEVGLVPPIAEATDDDGTYVLDGAHRTGFGRWQGRTHFMGVRISGIRPDCPGYAFPNSWDEMRIMEAVPCSTADKKRYRGPNYRSLYRDFSLLNGSKLREVSSS